MLQKKILNLNKLNAKLASISFSNSDSMGIEGEEYNGAKALYESEELCEANADSINCRSEFSLGTLNTNFNQLPFNPVPPISKNPNPGGGARTMANIDCRDGSTDKAYLGCYNNVSSYGSNWCGNSVTSYSISMGINTSANSSHAVALGNEADANAIYDVSVGASAGQSLVIQVQMFTLVTRLDKVLTDQTIQQLEEVQEDLPQAVIMFS